MSNSVQYSALARLLSHNNRAHDLEEIMKQSLVPTDYPYQMNQEYEELPINPFAELQDEFEKEVRASLVTCWLAIPETDED